VLFPLKARTYVVLIGHPVGKLVVNGPAVEVVAVAVPIM
jgi:hypothetical protein